MSISNMGDTNAHFSGRWVDKYHMFCSAFIFSSQVHTSFRCTYEETSSDCPMAQSVDGDQGWRLITAGNDRSTGGFDHTTLSGDKSKFIKCVSPVMKYVKIASALWELNSMCSVCGYQHIHIHLHVYMIHTSYRPFTRCVKLWVPHAPGMPGTFSPPPTSKETAS